MDDVCKLCSTVLTGCNACAMDGSTCDAGGCDSALGFISDGAGGCECGPGYYPDGLICAACIPGCTDCADGTTCDASGCTGPNYVINGADCECGIGYTYDTTGTICLPCSAYGIGCAVCQNYGSSFQCDTCDSGFVGPPCNCTDVYDPYFQTCLPGLGGNGC